MKQSLLIAVGGNSLIRSGQRGTFEEQQANARVTCDYIAALIEMGHQVILTHGNGPQVGAQLLRSETASTYAYTLPLDGCDAATQGETGYLLETALRSALQAKGIFRQIATILTQVVVKEDDPAFENPTKPIGQFYSQETAEQKERELGWKIVEDAARGYRRVVPSPIPVDIVELEVIRHCVQNGILVIAVGGGGIPVILDHGHYQGVEAVIDKDRASVLLARKLGLEKVIVTTDADRVYLNHKKPDQRPLDRITVSQARQYFKEGHFPPGSMGPKIEAAIDFLTHGGKEVIITQPEFLARALEGKGGTSIVADERNKK
jgi:carbamate kinase